MRGALAALQIPSRLPTTPPEIQKLQNDFMEAAFAVRDHFGAREASEEEVLAFLRERDARKGAVEDDSD